jgi:hypothetical protein
VEDDAMNTDHRLIAWGSAWALVGGLVVCVVCKRRQPATHADEPFPHAPGCTAVGHVDECPWVSLHDVLDRERG